MFPVKNWVASPKEPVRRELRIKQALSRVAEYEQASKFNEVRRALLDKGVSKATIANWFKSSEINVRAEIISSAYRWRDFTDVVEALADLRKETRDRAYEFALSELGLRREDQVELISYDGTYAIHHDLKQWIKLNIILVRVEARPLAATFVFRYRNKDGERGECDGLIVTRHGKLLFTGFSETAVFHAVIKCAPNPRTDMMRGIAIVEDLISNEVYFSRIAIQRVEVTTRPQELQLISKHVDNSSYFF